MKTKTMLSLAAAACVLCQTACARAAAEQSNPNATKKPLIAYFSATGTTARAAERLAGITGGELYEIVPEKPYTTADLDWHNSKSRSSVEMNDPKARPAIRRQTTVDAADYDVIFIGYPIWWGEAPRIIQTFIESLDLKGKTVIPFATSGSSGIAASEAALRKAYPKANWKAGLRFNQTDEKTIRAWLKRTGYPLR